MAARRWSCGSARRGSGAHRLSGAGPQALGERDIAGVVGAEVRAQLEHAWQQRLVAVPGERQKQVVLESQLGSLG